MQGSEQGVGVASADLHDDRDADRRRHEPEPEDLLRSEQAGREQQQDADEHRADLSGDPVHERHRLGSMGRRQDVVGRAPGRVRDAALGHLLDDGERGCRRERERHDPQTETAQVDEGQEQRRAGDAEPPIEPVGDPERHDERDAGDRRGDESEDPRQLGLVREGGPRREQVRERDREHQDREQHVCDRDEAEQRRLTDLVKTDTDIRHDRAAGSPLDDPARADMTTRQSSDQNGRRREQDALRCR